MRSNAFIIAEYNPFHNGHLYHIEQTKKNGAENIIVIMSGNYVQRGEGAVIPKHRRAEAAVIAGADLVLELPLKYAVSGSGYFAYGALQTALLTGMDGTLSFGAESELSVLQKCAEVLCSPAVHEQIKELCRSKGYSYPRAQSIVAGEILGKECSHALSMPNNILAIQYMIENIRVGSPFDYFAVRRAGVSHDSGEPADGFMSAKLIREQMESKMLPDGFIPEFSVDIINECKKTGTVLSKNRFEVAAISRLQTLSSQALAEVNGVNHGLENPLYNAICKGVTLDEIYISAKSKRYTLSRIRQVCLSAVLGLTRSDLDRGADYIGILGFNEKGRALLRKAAAHSSVPFCGLLSQAFSESSCDRDAEVMRKAEIFYNLCLEKPAADFSPFRLKPFVFRMDQ